MKTLLHKTKSLTALLTLITLLILPGVGWGQTSTQNFGTITGSHTSSTGSTSFLPNPTSGTTWARGGAVVPNAPINLVTASNPLGTSGAYVRAAASSTTSVAKFSPWVAYTGSTEFYTSFKVLFGDASAGATATSGSWSFYQGAGTMYSDVNNFAGAQVFTGLQFTYGAEGAIALTYRGGSSWTNTGLTTSTFSSATVYTVEIVGNNKTDGTIIYTYNGVSQTVAVQKFDLYINGSLIGDDLAEALLPANTSIASGTFIGISSPSNVANIFVDDAVTYNVVPATIGSISAPTTQASNITFGSVGQNGMNTSWTNGDGAKRIVIMNTSNSFTNPTDGTDPTSNTTYSGSGEQVVYNGSSNSVAVTGLSASTTYWFRAYEYNGSGTGTLYLTSTATNNPNSQATAAPAPLIATPVPTSLSGFSTVAGTASTAQTFTISGTNLTADLVVTAPTDYEVRENENGSYGSSVSFTPSSGTVAEKTIQVRIAASAGIGSPSGNVTCTSTDATTQNVAVSGTVSAPPTITFYFRGPSWMNNNPHNPQIWGPYNGWTTPPAMTYDVVPGWWSVTVEVADASASIEYQSRFSQDGTTKYQKAFENFGANATFTTTTGEIWIDASQNESFTWSGNDFYLSQNKITQNQPANEPASHATVFSATANSSAAITISWTDSDAASYLIKGSDVGYGSITAPVDGTVEADGGLVKNIAATIGTYQFTGLTANTTYYFKIYPYNGVGDGVNYKTDGSVPEASATTDEAPAYSTGDFGFTATTGNWGTTSTNWKQWDGSGWNTTPSGVPTIDDNVYILSGNTAIVETGGKNAKNLTVETGAKLYTNNTSMTSPRYINVAGAIICNGTIGNGAGNNDVISFNISGGISSSISGSGSFTANRVRRNNGAGILNLTIGLDMELRYNGDALYNATTTPDATQAFNVTINEGKHVNLTGNGATPIAGYTLKSVDLATIYGKLTVTGTLANAAGNAGLVIKSTATGTGSLIHSTAGVNATVERYLVGYNAVDDQMFHFISSPVAGQAIREEFVTNTPTSGHDFYKFDEVINTWVNTKDGDGSWNSAFESNFGVGKGYLVAYPSDVTKEFTGTLNASEAVLTCTNTAPPAGGSGWNLLGNPFPSAIDWAQVSLGDGIDNALYYYDNAAQNYRYYLAPVSGDETSLGSGQQYIPAMQGFMVHAKTTGTKTVSLPLAARTHSGQDVFYKSTQTVPGSLSLKVAANGYEDEAFIHFNQNATTAFDGSFDAYKLRSYSDKVPMIYTKGSDGSELSINGLPELDGATVIPVFFNTAVNGAYELTANLAGLPGATVYLQDLGLNKTQNLSVNPVYSFTATSNDPANRFNLTFGSVGIDNPTTGEAVQVYAHSGLVYMNGVAAGTEVTISDITGRVVKQVRASGNGLTTLNVSNLPHGMYIVTMNSGKELQSRKIIL
jgi:hypothetical protein